MKGFERKDQSLSLCGLNCRLCPMFFKGYCPGGGEGNQSCKIARCSMEHGGVEYCFQCGEYPCEKYEQFDRFDSFITHRARGSDLEKARQLGLAAYHAEQIEKATVLNILLSDYDDGRRQTLFCTAVNLLDRQELQAVLRQAEKRCSLETLTRREKGAYVSGLLEEAAAQKELDLKLRRKK